MPSPQPAWLLKHSERLLLCFGVPILPLPGDVQLTGNSARYVYEIPADVAQPFDRFRNRISLPIYKRTFAEQICPDFHVCDDMGEGLAQQVLVNVELFVQQFIGQSLAGQRSRFSHNNIKVEKYG